MSPISRIERRFSDQPVNTSFGSEVTIGIPAANMDGRAFDTCNLAV